MNATPRPLAKSIGALVSATLLFSGGAASAVDLIWNPDGASGAPLGGVGAWDTTSLFWDNTGVMQAWNNAGPDTAIFDGTGGAVTIATGGITAGGVTFNVGGYSIVGAGLTLGATGVPGTIAANADATIGAVLSGTAGISKSGGGVLTLSGANNFSGQLIIGAGTVRAGNASALGASGAGNETVIQSGATFDINAIALTNTEIFRIAGTGVGGNGAIVNMGGQQLNALNRVELTADASVGGTGRFDIRPGATPTLDLAGHTLTKVGGNQVSVVNGTITAGNIVVDAGTFSIETTTSVAAAVGSSITLNANGTLGLYQNTAANFTRDIVSNGGAIRNLGVGGGINSDISLTIGTTLRLESTAAVVNSLNGVISGDGNLSHSGAGGGIFLLTNDNTYTGTTTVTGGVLQASKPGALPGYNAAGRVVVTGGAIGLTIGGATGFQLADIDAVIANGTFQTGGAVGFDTSNGDFVYGTAIPSGVGVRKLGGNKLTLTAANSYEAGVTVDNGTLAIPGGTIRSNISFENGGGAATLEEGTIEIPGTGLTITSSGSGATNGRDRTISTPITGNGPVTLAANGDLSATGGGSGSELTLSGANTFTGNVSITAGLVAAGSNFGDAANSITLSNGGLVHNGTGTLNFTNELAIAPGTTGTLRAYGSTTLAIASGITGGGVLSKTDGGTVQLDGANTYTGATNINGGTLVLGPAGSITNGTGIRVIGGAFTNQGDIKITGNGVQSDATSAVSIGVNNGQTFNQQGGTVSIVNYGANGTTNISGGVMNVSGIFYIGEQTAATARAVNQTGGTLNLTTLTANAIRLSHWNGGAVTYTMSGGTLDASGALSNVIIGWDGPATMTVGGGASPALMKARGVVVDGQTASTHVNTLTISPNGTVEVGVGGTSTAGTAAADKIILNGGTLRGVANSTWSAQLTANTGTSSNIDVLPFATVTQGGVVNNAGTGTLAKTGEGHLVLSGANTFDGILNVDGGALVATNAATFGGAATVNVNAGGALSGTGSVGGTSTTNLVGGGSVKPGANANPGTIGTLTVGNLNATSGTLHLDLNATNSAQGGTTNDLLAVTGSVVNLGGLEILPRFTAAPSTGTPYTIVTSTNAPVGSPALSPLVSGANSSLALTVGAAGNNTTLSVTGAVRNLTWNGDGGGNAWDLNTASNFQVTAANDATFKSYDNVTFDDTSANATVNVAGTLLPLAVTVNNSAGDYTFAGSGTIQGASLTKQGTGTLTIATDNVFTTSTTISGGTLQIGAGGATGSIGLGGLGVSNITNNGTLIVDRTGTLGYNAVMSGSGSLVKEGSSSLLLTGVNTYTGGTTVNAGELILSASGGSGTVRGNLTINAGATVRTISTDALGFTGGAQVATLRIDGGTFHNSAGNQGYRTNVVMKGGTLSSTGGAFNFTNGFSLSTEADAETATISSAILIRDTNDLAITTEEGTTADGIDLLISGNISGAAVSKFGEGTLLLTGNNTYGGSTTIAEGTLLNNGTITASAASVFGTDAVLGGTGTMAATTLLAGTIAPGVDGAGVLRTGNLALDGGSVEYDLGVTSSDRLETAGTVAFGAPVELKLAFDADFTAGQTFTLIANDAADAIAVTGGFALSGVPITPGVDFTYTSGAFSEVFQLTYAGGTGNDAMLTVVPEPTAALATILGGIGMLLGSRRRRAR